MSGKPLSEEQFNELYPKIKTRIKSRVMSDICQMYMDHDISFTNATALVLTAYNLIGKEVHSMIGEKNVKI